MGFRDRQPGDASVRRYKMREKLLSVGDDYWIEDESGARVFKVDGKAFRIRDMFVLRNSSGDEVVKIQERKLTVRDKMRIEWAGQSATVHKALIGIRDRYKIDVKDGPELAAHGNLVDHEYQIDRDGRTVATVSKKWFRLRDSYGVEVDADQDQALMLAVTVCIDEMSSP